jgi:hypothetical protein
MVKVMQRTITGPQKLQSARLYSSYQPSYIFAAKIDDSEQDSEDTIAMGEREQATQERRRKSGFKLKLGPNDRRLLSGAIAGAFSRITVAPLETIRTHLMVGSHGHSLPEIFH